MSEASRSPAPAALARLRDAEAMLGESGVSAEGRRALLELTAGRPVRVAAPEGWLPWVDAARRAWSTAGRGPWVAGLPPCLQMTRRPMWPAEPVEPAADVACAAAAICPADACPHATAGVDSASPLKPLRHGGSLRGVHAAIEGIAGAWGHASPPVVMRWLKALDTAGAGSMNRPDRFEFSLKRVGDRLAPRLRLVDLAMGPVDTSGGRVRRARITDGFGAYVTDAVAASSRAFLALFDAHHGPSANVSVGIDAPLDGGPPRLQLYGHQGADRPANRAHLLETLRWSGADPDDLARMAAFVDERSVALVVFAPSADDPRGVKVYVGAPFDAEAPGLGLPPLTPPPFAAAESLVVWRCGAGGLKWEKRDFRSVAHPQRSEAVIADFVDGLSADDRRRASRLLDGRPFLPWFTWVSVRPGVRTVYFHAC